MENNGNSNYGRAHCFDYLLNPVRDDPIFIGINRLVVTGLEQDEKKNNPIQYPCPVAKRFECQYDNEKGKISNARFDVEDLFELANIALW